MEQDPPPRELESPTLEQDPPPRELESPTLEQDPPPRELDPIPKDQRGGKGRGEKGRVAKVLQTYRQTHRQSGS